MQSPSRSGEGGRENQNRRGVRGTEAVIAASPGTREPGPARKDPGAGLQAAQGAGTVERGQRGLTQELLRVCLQTRFLPLPNKHDQKH